MAAPANSNTSELLAHADAIKTVDNEAFAKLLAQLEKDSATFSTEERWQLRYLEAWEEVYVGNFAKAQLQLGTIIRETPIDRIRMHASATLVNILGYSHRYEDAYTQLDQALDQLPRVSDKDARFHVLGEASQLLAGAGQYDLAANYADQIVADYKEGRPRCIGMYLKSHADFLRGHLDSWNEHAQQAIEACVKVSENLFADAARQDVASLAIRQNRTKDALSLLERSYPSVIKYQYPELVTEYDVLLAQAYWQMDDAYHAEGFALKTVDAAQKGEYTEPLATAYRLLYQIERERGNLRGALAYHEKYLEADKGRLDDVREKALAYQFVKQQVEAKKVELDKLNKKNQILQLQQALGHKEVETSRLYIALLLTVLASIGFWLYRLKRSQLRFMRLARRDGLTGIFNRQHFVEETEQALRYVAKSLRGACLILIDLDHFKTINDTYGHVAGDNALKRTVLICQQHLHSGDVFGRIGGEEFGILLPECTLIQALERAERIRLAVQAVPDSETEQVPLTASFGIASTTHYGYHLRHLLVAADDALYRAKRDGRNRVVMSMNERSSFAADRRTSYDTVANKSGFR
ncbi:GGDEF domain-containing protein [Dyella acidisoli]|uniref:diguanylate cyclase n=1 Tax=Dyella acidisoli TaxID=1867834 RepID=A0ABQ5XP44_9GAMM|nr:GGDEF domain-containing protein [Dyella acidisoli]GLQ92843.1 GGDEF domain-containing protein [Dyella acidisoli]